MSAWQKPFVTVGGGLLVLGGVVMLVTPGPGIVAIAAGLALWGREYAWARRLLAYVRARTGLGKHAAPKPGGGDDVADKKSR